MGSLVKANWIISSRAGQGHIIRDTNHPITEDDLQGLETLFYEYLRFGLSVSNGPDEYRVTINRVGLRLSPDLQRKLKRLLLSTQHWDSVDIEVETHQLIISVKVLIPF